jgi:enoyl-CoA hydratase
VTNREPDLTVADDVITTLTPPVARVTINRPQAMNSLAPGVLTGLDAAIDAAAAAGCSVLVVRGAGGTLSAGADLKFLRSCLEDPEAVRGYITAIGAVLDRIEAAPLISVCAVEGYAVAGGCELLLACDIAIATEECRIGDRHLEYGLLPGAGGSVRLSRAIPAPLARRLLYTADLIDGSTALAYGLVSELVPASGLDDAVERLVARLARHDVAALLEMKRLHRAALVTQPHDALIGEREALLQHLKGPSVREGLAAFAERRRPDFTAVTGEVPA